METKNSKTDIINRLKRIEGQIRGLQNMIINERNCSEILTQLSAVKGAINKVSEEIMKEYTRTCLIEYEETKDEKLLDELIETISRFREI
ncbi:MAG TPA: metal-sensitive transcriptional regulator [Defluviitoga sp.]|nr:metal-sensitive transcriptional regulator [Defluviitoga sp.]HOP24729.1 metal-sensitive transcriptional regulator [Defluviitoga sp.]HPZ28298.1 metal-sensitive transcriptional regulator [Defluviitoga sp.]HQD62188.1 metal-sensitive transcriptional regulator [Defluviitoga sp.]